MNGNVTWVAVAALVVSLFTLGWNIFSAIRTRPRLQVGLTREVYTEQVETGEYGGPLNNPIYREEERVRFVLTVLNAGKDTTTVYNAGLRGLNVDLGVRTRPKPGMGHIQFGRQPWAGPDVPVTLTGGAVEEWRFHDSYTKDVNAHVDLRGFVEQARPNRRPRVTRSRSAISRRI